MATFTDVSSFADHVAGYGKRLAGAQARAVKATAEAVGIVVRQHGSRYHIKGRTGKKWALSAKITGPYGYAGNWIAYVTADPAGFWHLIEKGAGAHVIRPRRRGRGGRNSRRALSTPYGVFAVVHHPGTGSIGHPWESAMAQARTLGPQVFKREVLSVFGKAA